MYFTEHADRLYDTLWLHALIGVALVSRDGTFLAANPAFCKMTEYTEAELKTKKYQDITHPDDVSYDQLMASELVLGKIEGYDMPKRYLTKFGRVVNMMSRVAAVRQEKSPDQQLICFLSQMAPLSEQQINLPQIQQNMERVRRKMFWKAVLGNWPALMFALGLMVSIIVQVMERIG